MSQPQIVNRFDTVDMHVHNGLHAKGPEDIPGILQSFGLLLEKTGAKTFASMSVTQISPESDAQLCSNALSMVIKALYPTTYAYGSLEYFYQPNADEPRNLVSQAREFMRLGFEGIKMIEGNPNFRKSIALATDSPLYEPYFTYVEENEIPLVWHIADPPHYWRYETCPERVQQHLSGYWDGSYVPYEEFYREALAVLERHPYLYATFAHFAFLSADLDRLSAILDKYPNVCVDLTPGSEMFVNFAKNREEARAFFYRYHRRILFGTDNYIDADPAQCVPHDLMRYGLTQKALESNESYTGLWDTPCHGLNLDDYVLKDIYAGNFYRHNPALPKRLDVERAIAYCDDLMRRIQLTPMKKPGCAYDMVAVCRQSLISAKAKEE